jgi:hypothetical protein
MDRRVRLAATELAEEIMKKLMELADRREPLFREYAKRNAALMDKCERHVEIIASLHNSETSEAVILRKQRECEAVVAVLDACARLTDRYNLEVERIESRLAALLEELWPALRHIGARERGRLMRTFCFWLQKTKGRN